MNKRFVFYLIGHVLMLVSPLPALCALVAWRDNESFFCREVAAFMIPSLGMLLLGSGLWYFLKNHRQLFLLRRDGIGVVSLSWLLVGLFGAIPFYLTGATFAQSFFESVSGFTTTGSSIYGEIESLPTSILLWRSLTQWVGGLGILVFMVALLSRLGIRGRSLMGAESSVNIESASTPKIKDLAVNLLWVYLALSLLCFIALLLAGSFESGSITMFEAVVYSMTTVSTGGFAPHNNSAAHFDSPLIESVLIVFMWIASLSFVLIYQVVFNRDKEERRSRAGVTEAIAFSVLIVFVLIVVVADLCFHKQLPVGRAIREAAFPIVSMASSTGFGTSDYDSWPTMARIFLAFVMIVGGCGGSTAGGIKVMRFLLLLKILHFELQKTFRPRLVTKVRVDGFLVTEANLNRNLVYIAMVGFIIAFSSAIVSIVEPQVPNFEVAMGSVLATFFNMGPGFGTFGPTDNFGGCHAITLYFYSWLMLLGRLEIFVLIALFSPGLWKVH